MNTTHNMPALNNKCGVCSKRILKHKVSINCVTCNKVYHPKCVKLMPRDVTKLQTLDLHRM